MRLYIAVFLTIGCFLYSHNSFSQKRRVLISAGANFYHLKGNTVINFDSIKLDRENGKFGIQAGYKIDFGINKYYSIATGLEFYQKNVKKINDIEKDYKFNYMSFPLLINFSLLNRQKLSIGLHGDYLLDKKNVNYFEFDNSKSGFLNFDLGLMLGFNSQINSFLLELSSSWGLLNIVHRDKDSIPVQQYAKSRMIKLGLSYILE